MVQLMLLISFSTQIDTLRKDISGKLRALTQQRAGTTNRKQKTEKKKKMNEK